MLNNIINNIDMRTANPMTERLMMMMGLINAIQIFSFILNIKETKWFFRHSNSENLLHHKHYYNLKTT